MSSNPLHPGVHPSRQFRAQLAADNPTADALARGARRSTALLHTPFQAQPYMSTLESNVAASRRQVEEDPIDHDPTASIMPALPACLQPLTERPLDANADAIPTPSATLAPYVPRSMNEIPLPKRVLVDPRDQHTVDLQISKLVQAFKESGRDIDQYSAELQAWSEQVESSEADKTRRARSRMFGRWIGWIRLKAPNWPESAAWNGDCILEYGPSFLRFLLDHVKRPDGKALKSRTLACWFGLFVQCIIRYAVDAKTGKPCGTVILAQHELFNVLRDQVFALTRVYGLDRRYSNRIYYGPGDLMVILEDLLSEPYKDWQVVLQHCQQLIFPFYFGVRASTLGPVSQKHEDNGAKVTFRDVSVLKLDEYRWRIQLRFHNFKVYAKCCNRPYDKEQTYNLDSVEAMEYALLDGPTYCLPAWYARGLFCRKKYPTFLIFLTHSDPVREIVPEALDWHMSVHSRPSPPSATHALRSFRAVKPGGSGFVNPPKAASSRAFSNLTASRTKISGIPSTGVGGWRRGAGEQVAMNYGLEMGRALLAQAPDRAYKVLLEHYTHENANHPFVGMRLCTIDPTASPEMARRYREQQELTAVVLDAVVRRTRAQVATQARTADGVSESASIARLEVESSAALRAEAKRLAAEEPLSIEYEAELERVFAEFKSLFNNLTLGSRPSSVKLAIERADNAADELTYKTLPTRDLAQTRLRAVQLQQEVAVARQRASLWHIQRVRAHFDRLCREELGARRDAPPVGTLQERADAIKRLKGISYTQRALVEDGQRMFGTDGLASASTSTGPDSTAPASLPREPVASTSAHPSSTHRPSATAPALVGLSKTVPLVPEDDSGLLALDDEVDARVLNQSIDSSVIYQLKKHAGTTGLDEDELVADEFLPPTTIPLDGVSESTRAIIPSLGPTLRILTRRLYLPLENSIYKAIEATVDGVLKYHCQLCLLVDAHLADERFTVQRGDKREFLTIGEYNKHLLLQHSFWRQLIMKIFRDGNKGLKCPACDHHAPDYQTLTDDHMLVDCVDTLTFSQVQDMHKQAWIKATGKRPARATAPDNAQANAPHSGSATGRKRAASPKEKASGTARDSVAQGLAILEEHASDDPAVADVIDSAQRLLDWLDDETEGDLPAVDFWPSYEDLSTWTLAEAEIALEELQQSHPDDEVTLAMERAVEHLSQSHRELTLDEYYDAWLDACL
ncbi:uncharacterized protein SCHCODRAFT_02674955 [Schizophyllum commune H4-8]|uniref:uncharacterized protein n=1 Tax=Schizophyllum commune (strain H4-8 / FGSC 9210) TaxID=578458 RepID=UPI00215F6E10|nr:uncharacterized protein SCHCODRAFT_02674955 [Schizophyllum commune H4-8]KAI5900642.1 hypothetical protein SCHCODRAFT_02674955 [Schizophyllum commune H4-8]